MRKDSEVTTKVACFSLVIVLQASSRSAYPNSLNEKDGYNLKDMEEYCGKFVRLARSHGAQPVLHCTQAASGKPEDRQRVVRQYTRLAKMFDVVMAPCGAAWQRAYQQRGGIVLDVGDAVHHQNRSGAYLSACVFSAVLSGKSPADSPVRGPTEAAKKQPKLDDPTAEFLQSTAWETFQTYEQKGDVKVRTRSK